MNAMHQTQSRPATRKSGFTLVELMVVIVIIGILAGLILGFAGYASGKGDRSRAIADIEKWKDAVEEYRIKMGKVPSFGSPTGVTNATFLSDISNYVPTAVYVELTGVDPWGNAYLYERTGKFQYRLWSTGPNSLESGDDITAETGMQ